METTISLSIVYNCLQALLVADFGPRTSLKIIDAIRKDILAGEIKSGEEIKVCLLFSSGLLRFLSFFPPPGALMVDTVVRLATLSEASE